MLYSLTLLHTLHFTFLYTCDFVSHQWPSLLLSLQHTDILFCSDFNYPSSGTIYQGMDFSHLLWLPGGLCLYWILHSTISFSYHFGLISDWITESHSSQSFALWLPLFSVMTKVYSWFSHWIDLIFQFIIHQHHLPGWLLKNMKTHNQWTGCAVRRFYPNWWQFWKKTTSLFHGPVSSHWRQQMFQIFHLHSTFLFTSTAFWIVSKYYFNLTFLVAPMGQVSFVFENQFMHDRFESISLLHCQASLAQHSTSSAWS